MFKYIIILSRYLTTFIVKLIQLETLDLQIFKKNNKHKNWINMSNVMHSNINILYYITVYNVIIGLKYTFKMIYVVLPR